MSNLNIAPLGSQIFSDQATMTMVGCEFAAEQARLVRLQRLKELLDMPLGNECVELSLILRPVDSLLPVGVEQVLRRRELGTVEKTDRSSFESHHCYY